jgi:peptide deformylase
MDAVLKKLIRDMRETMDIEDGIGIAAPQVGVNIRMALAKLNPGTNHENIIVMINPEIIKHAEEKEEHEEGCLSLRKKWGKVPRWTSLTVKYHNQKMESVALGLDGLNARIIQHEIDHLDGKLFIDRVVGEVREE